MPFFARRCRATRPSSSSYSIRVQAGSGVAINDCDITGNAGFGVNNLGAFTVDARDNWWDSAAGPGADGANAVSGAVIYEPFRTAPIGGAGAAIADRGS
jgi:hypothetical protein